MSKQIASASPHLTVSSWAKTRQAAGKISSPATETPRKAKKRGAFPLLLIDPDRCLLCDSGSLWRFLFFRSLSGRCLTDVGSDSFICLQVVVPELLKRSWPNQHHQRSNAAQIA
jgi:hypothetical protein